MIENIGTITPRLMRGAVARTALLFVIVMTLTGCHSSRKASGHHSKPTVHVVNVKGLKGMEKKIVEEALSWRGTPYKYGASEKGKGTDCSGMVIGVYEKVTQKKLPRNSAKQAEFCKKLKRGDVRPGDLVFFATGKDKNKISHVGIMVDEESFVHASTQKGVLISEMNTPYYQRTFKMYGRVP